MAIAIIIGTHGAAAEQLLKTAEMLLGEQDNVAFIDFVPGENAETLIVKYNEKISGLNTSGGVLFLVDTWGGSPFNAASRIAVDKDNYEVVTGVNIRCWWKPSWRGTITPLSMNWWRWRWKPAVKA